MFNADFTGSTSGFCSTGAVCVSTDTSNLSAYVLMANAYVDFWSYGNFTAYVGGEVLKLLGICRRCILRGDSSSTGFSL